MGSSLPKFTAHTNSENNLLWIEDLRLQESSNENIPAFQLYRKKKIWLMVIHNTYSLQKKDVYASKFAIISSYSKFFEEFSCNKISKFKNVISIFHMLKKRFSNLVWSSTLFVYTPSANNHDLLALWEICKNNDYDEDDET